MTTYNYVSGGYQLNPVQQELLRHDLALAQAGVQTDPGLGGQIYTDLLSFIAPNGTPLTGVDPYVVQWLQGAIGVNANTDSQATVIRTYTQDMYQLLNNAALTDLDGDTPTGALNRASNQIAITLALEILNQKIGNQTGFIPDITTLGTADAGGVTSTLFGGVYSPWAGTILFPYLNTPSFYQDWLLNMGTESGTVPNAAGGTSSETFKTIAGTYNLVAALEAFGQIADTYSGGKAMAEVALEGHDQNLTDPSGLAADTVSFFLNSYGLTAAQAPTVGAGTPFDSILSFTASPYYIAGTTGNDTLSVVATLDTTLVANAGPGDDTLNIHDSPSDGLITKGIIDGGTGFNTASYSSTSAALTFTLENPVTPGNTSNPNFSYRFEETSTGQNGSEFLYEIQSITGNSGGDTLNFDTLVQSEWNGLGQNIAVNLGSGTNAVNLQSSSSSDVFFVTKQTAGDVIISSVASDSGATAVSYGVDLTNPGTITANGNGKLVLALQGGSGSIAFDADTYSNLVFNPATNVLTLNLNFGTESVATLSLNASTGAGTVTATSGETFAITGAIGSDVTALGTGATAETTLANDLSELNYSLTPTLDQDNFAYLNPTGTSHTVTGTVSGSTKTFTLTSSNNAPGASITGQSGKTNVILLNASSDLAQDSLSNIQKINSNGFSVTLTHAEFAAHDTTNSILGGGTIIAADGGTFNLNSVNGNATAAYSNLTATDWLGTTLVGNNYAGQILTASLLGNDTLTAGTGTGDKLIAGEGVDTLTGGTGGDTFIAQGAGGLSIGASTLATGSTVTGSSTGNTLEVVGDISGDTISGIQHLITGAGETTGSTITDGDITLTNAEFTGFSTIATPLGASLATSTIYGTTSGTYNLGTKDTNTSDSFNMTALSNGGTTLIGNNASLETLTASATGTDTLTAGNGSGDQLIAGGGTDTLNGGTSLTSIIAGSGVDTLTAGTGGASFTAANGLASGSTVTGHGSDSLNGAGDISGATITGVTSLNPTGDVTLTHSQFAAFSAIDVTGLTSGITLNAANGGTYDLSTKSTDAAFNLTALSNSGTTLIGDSRDGETLTASATGTDTLTAGSGNNDVLVAGGGINTITGSTGTGGTIEAFSGLASGSTITGHSNILVAAGDITAATISGIGLLDLGGDVTVTNAEWTGFSGVNSNSSGGTLFASTAGTYNLSAKDSTTDTVNMTALSNSGTTLIGNSGANEILTASATGNDTLTAGSGTGDTLVAGGGNDILTAAGTDALIGGAGADKFVLGSTAALASTIYGLTSNDTIDLTGVGYTGSGSATLASGNVLQVTEGGSTYDVHLDPSMNYAGATFQLANDGSGKTDVEAASASLMLGGGTISLTQTQFAAYTSITGVGTIDGTTAGTYSLVGKGSAPINLTALSNSGTTLIGNNAAGETLTASATGNDTLTAGNGAGDVLVAGGGTDTLNGGANADTFVLASSSLAGDTISTSGGTENIVFTDPATVKVQSGEGATILGTDGTMNVATSGNTTINWNAGGSETQVFTIVSGTPEETDTGYSGTNGTGSVTYTLTASNYATWPVVSITGTGDITGLNNATITLADSTSATYIGVGGSATLGNDDTLTLGAPSLWDTVSVTGTGNSVTLSGGGENATLHGTSNTATATGSQILYDQSTGGNTLALTGSWGSAYIESGSGETANASGDHDIVSDGGTGSSTIALSGGSDSATLSGTGDTVTATGSNDGVTDNASHNTIHLNGASENATLNGGSDTITLAGNSGIIYEQGTGGDTISISGNSDGVSIQGSGADTVTFTGNNGFVSLHTSGNHITISGTSDTAYDLSTGGNTISLGGSSDSNVIYAGAGDTVNVLGDSESALDDGSGGCTMALSGNSDNAFANGSGDTVTATGSGDYIYNGSTGGSGTYSLGGSSNSSDLNGTGGHLTISGTSDTANDWGTSNIMSVTGNSNTVVADGTGGTSTLSGSSDTVNIYSTGNTINVTGSGDTASDGGSGSNSISLTGSGDTGLIYNSTGHDTLTVGGTSNAMTIEYNETGSGTDTISGSSALIEFKGISSDNITFNSGAVGIVRLDDSAHFTGTVTGFATADSIDLGNFLFSGTPTISSVAGTGATGTATDVTVTDGSAHATLALINQYANQFAVSSSAYVLAADGTTGSIGTFLQLAPGH